MKNKSQFLTFLRNTIVVGGVVIAALWVFVFVAILVSIYVSPFWNTGYASGYTQKKFDAIKIDMNKEQVMSVLGNPIRVYTDSAYPEEIWYYSFDKKFNQGRSNHFVRNVVFKDNKVVRITKETYFD